MLRYISILVFSFCVYTVEAQNKIDTVNWKPYSTQQFGILVGENYASFAMNITGGVQYKNAKAGIGFGANGYMIRSMPVYLDLRYDIGRRKTKMFLFSGLGGNFFPTIANNNYEYYYYYDDIVKKQVGTYAELGIGFKTKIASTLYYNSSVAYIYKKSRYIRNGPPFWNGTEWESDNPEQMIVENGMIALRVGLEF